MRGDPDLDPPRRRRRDPHVPRQGLRAPAPERRGDCESAQLFARAKRRHPRRRHRARCAPSRPWAARRSSSARAEGRALLGRRRPRLHRLRRLVGPDDPRPRASGRRRGRAARPPAAAPRYGAPCAAEVELAERIAKLMPVGREGALRLLRHRGHDERAAPGARLHRPAQDPEVRRLLPRPRRLACSSPPARASRRSASPARPACPRARWPTRSSLPTTTSPALEAAFARARARARRGDRRAGVRQHGPGRAARGLPRGAPRAHAAGTARC